GTRGPGFTPPSPPTLLPSSLFRSGKQRVFAPGTGGRLLGNAGMALGPPAVPGPIPGRIFRPAESRPLLGSRKSVNSGLKRRFPPEIHPRILLRRPLSQGPGLPHPGLLYHYREKRGG